MLVAGVDSSTQSTKVLLCQAEDGTIVARGSAPHPPGTECDPAAWWSALEQAGQGLLDRAGAIAVAAQQHGMVVVDEAGDVIRPALLWNDLRSAPAARELIGELGGPGWWAEHTGSVPSASFTVTNPAVPALPLKLSRYALTWQVTAFMGLQSLTFYAELSWLPTMFRDRGVSAGGAGTLLALMNLGGAASSLLIPVLAHRARNQRALITATVAASAAGLAGAWFAPLGGAAVWVLVLGLGQGASLGLAIFFTMARAPNPRVAASLSGFAQSVGYLVATTGPLAIGFLHSAIGGWTIPVAVLLVITGLQLAAGLAGGPGRHPARPWVGVRAVAVTVPGSRFSPSERRGERCSWLGWIRPRSRPRCCCATRRTAPSWPGGVPRTPRAPSVTRPPGGPRWSRPGRGCSAGPTRSGSRPSSTAWSWWTRPAR